MTLRRRLGSLLLAVGVILTALLSVAVTLLVQVRNTQDRVVNDYYDAITSSDDQFLSYVDAETAIRGYALTGDKQTLEPAKSLGDAASDQQAETIRAQIGDDPGLQATFTRTQDSARRWTLEWAVPTREAVAREGRSAIGPAEIFAGKALFDTVRADYAVFLTGLRERRSDAFHTLQWQTALLFGTILGMVLVAAALAVGVLALLMRWIVRPLDRLGAETRSVSEGDLGHAVVVAGPPEIEALASDVETMRLGLVNQLEDVRRSSAEVESARLMLESQAEDLQRSNRDLEQFAYVASHDLQEPLRKVASFCQLLQKRYGGQLDDRADQYISFAVDGAKRMQQLINDLLSFSRVGRTSAGTTEVDTEQCLAVALRNLELVIEESGATVEHDPLPSVQGESALLAQLLQNLIGNAVKFRRTDVAPVVRISASETEDEWEFSCADNGIGIESQYAERVFVIFQRLHAKDEYEGTGIGLALCRKIVEFHGGRIWIDPEVTSGTTIRWTLPRTPVVAAGTRQEGAVA